MKRNLRVKNPKTPKTKSLVLRFAVLAAIAIFTAGIVAAVTRMGSSNAEPREATSPTASPNAAKQEATLEAARRRLQGNALVLQQRPLTQDEARRLAEAIKEMTNRSTEGLKTVKNADGTVSMNLEDRFQNVMLARKNEDGTIEQACVDNPQAAAEFLGIDPALVGAPRNNQARPRTPARPAQ